MDNYNDIAAKESKLEEKKILVDDTIKVGKLSQYEIIKRMLDGLVLEIEELKQVLFTDLAVTNVSKEKAEKISKIAFTLQSCLDLENSNEIAENLNYLYRHIRFAAKNLLEKEKTELLTSAHFVSNEILEGWKGMSSSVA